MAQGRGPAIIHASATRAMIRAMGMLAENQQRGCNGDAPAYGEKDFTAIIDDEAIGWNTVMETLNRCEGG